MLRITFCVYFIEHLKISKDWRQKRASAGQPGVVSYEISNAGATSYPEGWKALKVCASADRKVWTRVDTTNYAADAGALRWTYDHGGANPCSVYFAYFDPYDYERHLDLIARCAAAPGSRVRSLGQTLDGRELDCVEVGDGPKHVWVIHRQHPGESQASWFAEGLLRRLLGLDSSGRCTRARSVRMWPRCSPSCDPLPPPASAAPDGLSVSLRRKFTFHVVPNMNPDGAVRGAPSLRRMEPRSSETNEMKSWPVNESPTNRMSSGGSARRTARRPRRSSSCATATASSA